MRRLTGRCLLFITIWSFTVGSLPSDAQRARGETPSATSATISSKTPVFAGACKACPWGILAKVTADALSFYGYRTTICWVCWSNLGPRYMADKTKPIMPANAQFYVFGHFELSIGWRDWLRVLGPVRGTEITPRRP